MGWICGVLSTIAGLLALGFWVWDVAGRPKAGEFTARPMEAKRRAADEISHFSRDRRKGDFFDSWDIAFESMRLRAWSACTGAGETTTFYSLRCSGGAWERLLDVESEKARLEHEVARTLKQGRTGAATDVQYLREEIAELEKSSARWERMNDEWIGALEVAYQRYIASLQEGSR
ncbi:MAG: hypothetical protein IPK60_04865 [Sandaracinaceae bacterium]|nr:hypothetical protein [Sandaracinaceae bacterium]